MFGHQDSSNNDSVAPSAGQQDDSNLDQTITPQTIAPTAEPSADDSADYTLTAAGSNSDDIAPADDASEIAPATAPIADIVPPSVSDTSDSNVPLSDPTPEPATPDNATAVPDPVMPAATTPADNASLYEIKIAALHELTPLIDHLEQTAEEKFKTMMMMIQASDDQTLLAEAYQAAHSIEDKKARAQALLDVVNEINYFTQQQSGSQAAQQQ